MRNFLNKLGRRAAGSWNKPRKKYLKRQSSKAIRRALKKEI